MDLKDTLGKVGKAAVNGVAWYLEETSNSCSRSSNFTDEQREEYAEFSGRMHDFRDRFNGRDEEEENDDYY